MRLQEELPTASGLAVRQGSGSINDVHLVQPVVIDSAHDKSLSDKSDTGSISSMHSDEERELEKAGGKASKKHEGSEPRRPHVLTWKWEHPRTGVYECSFQRACVHACMRVC